MIRTEREAYDHLIRLANDAGRRGFKLYGYGIVPPSTATGSYQIVIDARPMVSATETWEA